MESSNTKSGKKAQGKIKISVERAFKEISSLPESKRSWALAHRIFASCGVEYIKNDKGGVISLDGVKHYPAGKIADEVNIPNIEQFIGSTFRKPRKREEAELEQIRAERRKCLDAQAHPLPPSLMSAKHKSAYMIEYGLAREKWRLQEQRIKHLKLTARMQRNQNHSIRFNPYN